MGPCDSGPVPLPVPVPCSFEETLQLLATQHKLELERLREENQLLSAELRRLQPVSVTSAPFAQPEIEIDAIRSLEPVFEPPGLAAGLEQGFQSERRPVVGSKSLGCIVSTSGKEDSHFLNGARHQRRLVSGESLAIPEPPKSPGPCTPPELPASLPLSPEDHKPSTRRRKSAPSLAGEGEKQGSLGFPLRIPEQHRTFLVSPELVETHHSLIDEEYQGAETTDYHAVLPSLCIPGSVNDHKYGEIDIDTNRDTPSEGPSPGSKSYIRRGSSLQLEKAVSDLHSVHLKKQRVRFRHMLDLRGNIVYAEDLLKVVQKRGRADYTLDRARKAIKQMQEVDEILTESDSNWLRPAKSCQEPEPGDESGVFLHTFVQIVSKPDLWAKVTPEAFRELCFVRRILLPKGADEVISRLAKTQRSSSSIFIRTDEIGQDPAKQLKKLTLLNVLVGVCVTCSMVTLGLSTDFEPHWIGWLLLEIFFGTVFLAEVVIKVSILGLREYLTGWGWQWNVFDAAITLLTLFDLSFSVATAAGWAETGISAAKLTLVLRAVRLTRIARLVKLLHTPILAGLANMLAGFLVGVPCMFWVMVLLTLVFYVLGVCFRLLVGPSYGRNPMMDCGGGADEVHSDEPGCEPHILYGQEYFGTLQRSMFTVFRCVLGDCASKAGKSLTAVFSHGYGFPFDLVYCGGMVLVVFGLFNIIAAIFVETTISGLKYNTVQRKYARLYESHYVQNKLETLVRRIQELHDANHPTREGEFVLTEEEFNEVMQDDKVGTLLEDLDVVLTNRVGLFELFDCDDNGLVTVAEFVGTLMKLRGEPQKTDMIASWVALRALNDRFQNFERLILENQKRMLEYQRDQATTVPVPKNEAPRASKVEASPISQHNSSLSSHMLASLS